MYNRKLSIKITRSCSHPVEIKQCFVLGGYAKSGKLTLN